ncbi:MAG TPA: FmdB family zinc ribbon protein [Acidobacteriota bacterium]|nr:FmdB family zinc ribbon protein [Acidobacteriota bacterium]
MPLYEYQCTKCREVCEVLQKVKDKPLEKCPKCGGPVVKRISSPAIQFKGNGWYVTDYAKKNGAPAGAKAKPKAEDKPAADAKDKPAAEAKSDKPSS